MNYFKFISKIIDPFISYFKIVKYSPMNHQHNLNFCLFPISLFDLAGLSYFKPLAEPSLISLLIIAVVLTVECCCSKIALIIGFGTGFN